MFPTGVIVKKSVQALINLQKGFNFLRHTDVLVGVPEENSGTREDGVTNAELLFIHTNGSPARNIPARPVMQLALAEEDTRKRLQQMFGKSFRLVLVGNVDGAKKVYHQIGMVGASAVQKKFGTVPPPNAPSTVKKKGSSATLIDTGALRAAITYVVRKK